MTDYDVPYVPYVAEGERLGPVTITLAGVQPEHVSWLWPGRLPLGKLVVLDGDPAVGKSTLSVDLAARVSTAARWPDGTAYIYDLADGGASDDKVVRLCRDNDYQVLVSLNVRDFGARRYYYGALLDEGIHVVVGRWTQKGSQPDNGKQLSLFAMHYQALKKKLLSVEGPTLIMVTQSSIRVQDLSDLVNASRVSGPRFLSLCRRGDCTCQTVQCSTSRPTGSASTPPALRSRRSSLSSTNRGGSSSDESDTSTFIRLETA